MPIRDRILEVTARIYAESGYRGTTTRRIAEEAGVNEVTIFRQFGSKDALIHQAIQDAGVDMVWARLPDEPSDPRGELSEWSRAHLAELRKHRSLIRTCMAEIEEHPAVLPPQGSPPARAAQNLCRYLGQLRQQGLAPAAFDPMTASTVLMGTLFADAMGRDIMPDMYCNDPDDAVEQYVRLFLRAIGVSEP